MYNSTCIRRPEFFMHMKEEVMFGQLESAEKLKVVELFLPTQLLHTVPLFYLMQVKSLKFTWVCYHIKILHHSKSIEIFKCYTDYVPVAKDQSAYSRCISSYNDNLTNNKIKLTEKNFVEPGIFWCAWISKHFGN